MHNQEFFCEVDEEAAPWIIMKIQEILWESEQLIHEAHDHKLSVAVLSK